MEGLTKGPTTLSRGTIRWKAGPYFLSFLFLVRASSLRPPPLALPIEKEMLLKTTEIGSLTEMVRPYLCLSFEPFILPFFYLTFRLIVIDCDLVPS